jgi:hypothetical protein
MSAQRAESGSSYRGNDGGGNDGGGSYRGNSGGSSGGGGSYRGGGSDRSSHAAARHER